MKIGRNINIVKIILMTVPFIFGTVQIAYSADGSPPAPVATTAPTSSSTAEATPAGASSGATTAVTNPATVSSTTTSATPDALPAPPPPSISEVGGSPLPPVTKETSKTPEEKKNALNNAENKISDSVKDVLKKLDRPTDDVTLDDLNSARQAIAKIEILIEVEKHLADLEKIRHDRQKDAGMASMIPASALQPMPQPPMPAYTPPPVQVVQSQMPMQAMLPPAPPREPLDVSQISGESGHYSAIMKMTGDESKTVHVGDKLSDGSTVVDISSMEVTLERNNVKRTLHIKNVDTVFGNSF